MQLKEIQKTDFKVSGHRNQRAVFIFKGSKCWIVLEKIQEIRMSVDVYFDVGFFKNQKLVLSRAMQEPDR
ncbi:Putative protein [Zobellia galactanivorans]|uniref:Uncharacterized protein n=1 Tax=Zobellia galactanivorans (strain DSM 12802 / CCUG 47099 / CIP 106680 / NCIMB 13871 / Dsij) TaxID=63186 RepID=G0L8F0_ZOBGA|nr:Putative protein [Zobellia galactanivorans]